MRRIIEKYGSDDLDFVAGKLGAEIVEHPLGRTIKEAYFKDLGVIVIDPNLHLYKERHLIVHSLAQHISHRDKTVNYFIDQTRDFLKSLKVRKQEKEAEVFDAYFLIPEEKLNAILKEEWIMNSPDPIPELAEEFKSHQIL